jgi:hypothetical protein
MESKIINPETEAIISIEYKPILEPRVGQTPTPQKGSNWPHQASVSRIEIYVPINGVTYTTYTKLIIQREHFQKLIDQVKNIENTSYIMKAE